jgi:hypothetical protein
VSRPLDPAADPLARAFRIAYGLGLLLCLGEPLLLQALLGTAIPPGSGPLGDTVRQLGYTFTGLTLASALFVARRSNRVRSGFAALPAERRGALLMRETLLYSALFDGAALFGVAYYLLGGPGTERYARTFILLTSIMFFVFVPRLQAWREAAQQG